MEKACTLVLSWPEMVQNGYSNSPLDRSGVMDESAGHRL